MKNEKQTYIQSNSKMKKKKIFFSYTNKNISFLLGIIVIFSFLSSSKEEFDTTDTIVTLSQINLVIQGPGNLQIFYSKFQPNILDVIINGNNTGNS